MIFGMMLEHVHLGDFRAARIEQELFVGYLDNASQRADYLGVEPTFDELAGGPAFDRRADSGAGS